MTKLLFREAVVFSLSDFTSTGCTIAWYLADVISGAYDYLLIGSTKDNLSAVNLDELESDGRFVIEDWTIGLTEATVSGLTAGQKIFFNVLTRDELGNLGYYNTVSLSAPDAPSGLHISDGVGNMDLSWTDNNSLEENYIVERKIGDGSWEVIKELDANKTRYSDKELNGGNTYSYRVYAKNSFGNSAYSNTITETNKGISGLTARGEPVKVIVSWTDNCSVETAFVVERKSDSDNWVVRNNSIYTGTTYSDTFISSGVRYTYRVKGRNSYGETGYSDEFALSNVFNTVTYSKNGAETGTEPDDSILYYNGNDIELKSPEVWLLKAGGYALQGWNSKADGSGSSYSFQDTVSMGSNDLELFAEWKEFRDLEIGDRGPAGGWIFYDDDEDPDHTLIGIRFLEAAPRYQGKSVWGPLYTKVDNTHQELGEGKENTSIICSVLGSLDYAAGISDELGAC